MNRPSTSIASSLPPVSSEQVEQMDPFKVDLQTKMKRPSSLLNKSIKSSQENVIEDSPKHDGEMNKNQASTRDNRGKKRRFLPPLSRERHYLSIALLDLSDFLEDSEGNDHERITDEASCPLETVLGHSQ